MPLYGGLPLPGFSVPLMALLAGRLQSGYYWIVVESAQVGTPIKRNRQHFPLSGTSRGPPVSDLDDDFRSLIRRVRDGSEEAAWALVRQYGDAIRKAVRRALHVRLRKRFDSLDFVQIVWKSFFSAADNLDRFDRPEDLVKFLTIVARNKVNFEARRLTAERNDLRRELLSDDADLQEMGELVDPQPAPMEVAIAREQWERMLQGQPAHYRQLMQMRMQGHTYEEIGAAFHLDKGAVCRLLHRLFGKTLAGQKFDRVRQADHGNLSPTAKSP